MRRIRAHDKKTGEFVEIQRAKKKDESTRYSHEYRCLNEACGCTHHFRRATHAKENTESRPATFVKNPSSMHRIGCVFDYTAFAEKHRDVVYYDDELLHFRINFPLGGHVADQRPWEKGMLSAEQIRSAHNNIDKRGFGCLRDLVDFIEEKFEGGLEDMVMDDVRLSYQGEVHYWEDLFVPSDHYSKIVLAGRKQDVLDKSPPLLSVLKPSHLGQRNKNGKLRFHCETQYTRVENKAVEVHPVIVCANDFMAGCIQKVTEKSGSLLVASRPYVLDPSRKNKILSYFNVPQISQLAQVNPRYWRAVSGKAHQKAFEF